MDTTCDASEKCRACCCDVHFSFIKELQTYYQCENCGTFQSVLDFDCIETHNDKPWTRNQKPLNIVRADRIMSALGHSIGTFIDFGCGTGEFLNHLREYLSEIGEPPINAQGIDLDTKLTIDDLGESSIDAVSMVEVIEHLPDPTKTLRKLSSSLVNGGVIYVETGTVDALIVDGSIERSRYCLPSIGHCTIYSIFGLDNLAARCDMVLEEINSTVFIMRKQ